MPGRAARILVIALALVTAVVLVIVLSPARPAGASQDGLRVWIERAYSHGLPRVITFERVEWSANVVMFWPLGFLGRLVMNRWWIVLGCALVLSSAVETIQHFFLADRVGSIADVVANGTGALLGLLSAIALLRIRAGVADRRARALEATQSAATALR